MLKIETLAKAGKSPRDRVMILCGGLLGWTADALSSATLTQLRQGLVDLEKTQSLDPALVKAAQKTLDAYAQKFGIGETQLVFQTNSIRSRGKQLDRISIFRAIQAAARKAGVSSGGIGLLRTLSRLRREEWRLTSFTTDLGAARPPKVGVQAWEMLSWAVAIMTALQAFDDILIT